MKFNNITKFASDTFRRTIVIAKKSSPEILAVVGIAGIVTSAVMACVSSTKVKETVEEAKEIIEEAHGTIAEQNLDEKEARKEIATAYIKAGVVVAKPYVIPVTLGIASIGSLIGSNAIHRKRNAALATTCAMLDKSFKDYRARIIEKFGAEADEDARLGLSIKKIEKIFTDPTTGKEKKGKENIKVFDGDIPDDAFIRFFDELNPHYRKNAEYNMDFIKSQENYANKLLERDGFLYLNDVLDLLGMDRSYAGKFFGWVKDPEHPNKIDFGVTTVNRVRNENFLEGFERTAVLCFNVDGFIDNKVPMRKW